MHLIYVDESGTANFTDPEHFILSSLIINEKNWVTLDIDFIKLKLNFLFASNFELHTSEIAYFRKKFHGLSKNERCDILLQMSQLITTNSCSLISIVIDKEKVEAKNRKSEWVEEWAWRLLFERLEKFLHRRWSPSKKEYGLLCVDSRNRKQDNQIRDSLKQFRNSGSMYQDSKYLIEDPFFVKSEFRNMIQLVDFVAWVSRKEYNLSKKNSPAAKDEQFFHSLFETISIKFDRDISGNYIGAGYKVHP